jgi:putative phage-type endonuclease
MENTIKTIDMEKDEWLKARLPYLGASEVAVTLGLNPYRTSYDLWREKIQDPTYQPFTGNEFTTWGNRLEDAIAQGFAEDYFMKIRKDNKIRIHENGILSCSLDRVITKVSDKETPGILEIKNMSSYAYDKMLKDKNEIPLMYYAQHQQQFGITGYEWGYFVMLVGGNNMIVKEMVPDPEYIEKQNAEACSWWNDYVVAKIPPPYVVMDLTNPEATALEETVKVVDQKFFTDVYNKYQSTSKIIKDLTKVKDDLKDLLIEELGTCKKLEYMGSTICNWSEYKMFDSQQLKKDKPDLYAAYQNKPVRKFNVKEFTYEDKESA